MSEVVELNSRRRNESKVWQCQCGSFAFWLYSDGSACCADCKCEAVSMQGFWHVTAETQTQHTAMLHYLPSRSESSDD